MKTFLTILPLLLLFVGFACSRIDLSRKLGKSDVEQIPTPQTGGLTNCPGGRLQRHYDFEELDANGRPVGWAWHQGNFVTVDGQTPEGQASAWTVVEKKDGKPVFHGERAYKGWVTAAWHDSHRAYPADRVDLPANQTPIVNTYYVYLYPDINFTALSYWWILAGGWAVDWGPGKEWWFNFATSFVSGHLEFARTEPFHGEWVGKTASDGARPLEPQGRWIRLTNYIQLRGSSGSMTLWRDGERVLVANDLPSLKEIPSTVIQWVHWGMYAGKDLAAGSLGNDSIQLWQLERPLSEAELLNEPDCYKSLLP